MNPGSLAETHLHRATRTTTLSYLRGRDALIAGDMADFSAIAPGNSTIVAGLPGFSLTRVQTVAGSWSRHCWQQREDALVINETVVEDGASRAAALGQDRLQVAREAAQPRHAPLGELRAGTGQFAAGPVAVLPTGFGESATAAANALHRVWNGRDFGALDTRWSPVVAWRGPEGASGERPALAHWIAGLLTQLPDAVMLFEASAETGDAVALLWRLHGHHHGEAFGIAPTGKRVRLIGSTLLRFADGLIVDDETLIDEIGFAAQLLAPEIVY